MIQVKSIMNTPIIISKDSTVSNAIHHLQANNISRLLVPEDNSIITEKDIGIFLLRAYTDRCLDEIPISEITKPLFSIDQNTDLKECAKMMIENAFGSFGVTENSSILGIITKTDLVKYYSENFVGKKTVGEYSTWYYAWTYSDDLLFKVVEKMVDQRISRIMLRNENEIPEGILTFRDLFRVVMQGNIENVLDNRDPVIPVVFPRKGFLSETGFGGTTTAKEIMTKKIICVNYDDDLADACKILLENKINAVGVLSSRGTLVGVLSKTDVIRAIVFSN